MGEINWGLIDQNTPAKIATSFEDGRMNALAKQSAMQSQQMNALQLQKATREMAAEEQIRNALAQGGGNITKAMPAIMQADPKTGIAYQKMIMEQKTAELTQQKAKIESAQKTVEMGGQLFFGVRNKQEYDQARQQAAQFLPPEAMANIPPQYSPEVIDWLKNRSMTVKDQLSNQWKQLNYQFNASKFGYQQQNDTENRGVTLRGQDLTNARGEEANRLKGQENSINQQGVVGKVTRETELKLQDDYRAESKGWSEVSTSMKKVMGSLETADTNAGSALAAGTAFMKILDPNSVVRESELGMALNASGWFDRAANTVQQLKSGKVMTATQKKNLKAASETLFEEAKSAQKEIDAAYRQRAKAYGADPDRVIVDRGQNTPPVKPSSPKSTHITVTNPQTGETEVWDTATEQRVK